jgi:hypothetical protein
MASRFIGGSHDGRFSAGQTTAGPSVGQDQPTKARNAASKGMKDRAD